MRNVFQKYNKKDCIKCIAVIAIVILIGVMVAAILMQGFTTVNPNKLNGVIDENGNQLASDVVHQLPSKMSFTSAALATAGEQGVTITLQATVLPTDAQNKAVDWSVEWQTANTHGESPVADFLTVTPQSDGSNIANITCYKAFGADTILVKVTTQEGGFSATCVVSFVGNPSSLNIAPTGATVVSDSGWGVSIANVYSGNTYDFGLTFDNIYGSVDKDFVPNFECEVIGVGTYKLHRVISNAGAIVTDDTITVSPTDKVKVKNVGVSGEIDYDLLGNHLMDVKIVDGKLNLKVFATIASLDVKQAYNAARTSYYRYSFDSYTDNAKKPYFQIKVTEKNTGIVQIVNVRIESNVTGVTLDNSELTF